MTEESNAAQNTEKTNSGQGDGPRGYLRGVCIGGAWAFIGLLLTAVFWPNLTERTKFFTGNLLNLVIAFSVIAQVMIYRKQWRVMERQSKIMDRSLVIGTRAYIAIHSVMFDLKTGFLVIELENIGKVPTKGLSVLIHVLQAMASPPDAPVTVQKLKHDWGEDMELYPGQFRARIYILVENFDKEQGHLILTMKKTLAVGVQAIYGDGFGETRPSNFRFRYAPGGWIPVPISWEKEQEVMKNQAAADKAKENPN
jgi:hypothetical protein